MSIKKLNEEIELVLNESQPKTFAEWFDKDLTGQTYQGDIDCSGQNIVSLQGAPEKVGGSFLCDYNNLTTLQGAPKEVGGSFWCKYNNLTSLEGAPKEVGGYFKSDYKIEKVAEKLGYKLEYKVY